MITLSNDCLMFQMANGETVPFSAEMISVELSGDSSGKYDPHFVRHATNAVFHYFKNDLGRLTVTVGEFAGALEKVLRGFALYAEKAEQPNGKAAVLESDLCQIAYESGEGAELFFFPKLREEMRLHLQRAPSLIHFHGLRRCVKQLAGARRWSARCQSLQDRIVEFLRDCLTAEDRPSECTLRVE